MKLFKTWERLRSAVLKKRHSNSNQCAKCVGLFFNLLYLSFQGLGFAEGLVVFRGKHEAISIAAIYIHLLWRTVWSLQAFTTLLVFSLAEQISASCQKSFCLDLFCLKQFYMVRFQALYWLKISPVLGCCFILNNNRFF